MVNNDLATRIHMCCYEEENTGKWHFHFLVKSVAFRALSSKDCVVCINILQIPLKMIDKGGS